jgi:hypothetical protein
MINVFDGLRVRPRVREMGDRGTEAPLRPLWRVEEIRSRDRLWNRFNFENLVERILKMSPSKTDKQRRTMSAVAHNPELGKKLGIPQKVAKDFAAADRKAAPKKSPRKK